MHDWSYFRIKWWWNESNLFVIKIRTVSHWHLQCLKAENWRQNFVESLKQLDKSWLQQGNVFVRKFPWEFEKIIIKFLVTSKCICIQKKQAVSTKAASNELSRLKCGLRFGISGYISLARTLATRQFDSRQLATRTFATRKLATDWVLLQKEQWDNLVVS